MGGWIGGVVDYWIIGLTKRGDGEKRRAKAMVSI